MRKEACGRRFPALAVVVYVCCRLAYFYLLLEDCPGHFLFTCLRVSLPTCQPSFEWARLATGLAVPSSKL